MKRKLAPPPARIALLIAIVLCLAALLVACENPVEEPTTVTVTFEIDETTVTKEFNKGDKITTPTELEKVGTAIKWYTDVLFGTLWDSDATLTKDVHLYGKRVAAEITVTQAISLCTSETESAERYLIRATVKSIDNASYGQMTITDGTNELSVYGTRGADGQTYYSDMEDKPYAGDEVLLSATLQLFKGTPEVKMGWILEVKHNEIEIDETKYTQMTVAQAREAEKGALVKTSGIVSRIIYANGMKPCGFILIDDSSSMYVYDNQVAPRVAIGNTVTILGTKDYYVLDSEKTNAQKFGYKGCNQLTNVVLKENDEKTTAFNDEWITETTVKDIMETPVTEDIAALTFKVNALVKKNQGTGFVNYYFDDIDGETGSYAYTMCNGSDFAWLDEFDGKICTVYLNVLNCKASASGCVWRFIPVKVVDEGYTFDVNDAPDYALKYVAADQFAAEYSIGEETVIPAALKTSVSSELLGFENVELTYASANEDVVAFATQDDGLHLVLKAAGKTTITITATHGQNVKTQEIEIKIKTTANIESITVGQAIAAEVGTEITVKGIVGPSLVNQVGFYLIDESGVIAVRTDAATMAQVQLGNEVIIKGTRELKNDSAKPQYFGQHNINNCVLLSNDYGDHDYSTETFITDKTLTDLMAIETTQDVTTNVYVVTASIKVVESQYSSNIYVTVDGAEKDMILYCSSSKQYNWLKEFAEQTITIEIALCDWNAKGYKGCVLAVVNEDGTKICNELNFTK